jgi:hypothetical protein
MKKLLLALTLISFGMAQNTFACEKYEAQFVGFVTIEKTIEDGCILNVDFDLYNHHALCPLLMEEVQQADIIVDKQTCDAVANSHTGGYLSTNFKDNIITLEL